MRGIAGPDAKGSGLPAPLGPALIALALLCAFAPVVSQAKDVSGQQVAQASYDDYRARLESVLRTGGLDAALELAEAAINKGRYEQAVGILNSLVLRAPDNGRLKLLLGDLYTRMGSYAQAQVYLRQALESGQLSGEGRREARALQALARGGRAPDALRWSATIRTGLEYQSNVTGGTDEDTLLIGDERQATPATADSESDVDWYTFAFGQVSQPISEDVSLDGRGFVYTRKQFQENDYDLGAIQAQPGVAWDAVNARNYGVRVRPYGIFGVTGVADELALTVGGAGVQSIQRLGRTWFFDQSLEHRELDYEGTDERPTLGRMDGSDDRFELGATYRPTDTFSARIAYRFATRDTQRAYLDRDRHRLRTAITYRYVLPFEFAEGPSRVRLGLSYFDSSYDGPNPSISATRTREDSEWAIDLNHTLPVAEAVAFEVGLSYSATDSNLPNYEKDNFGASAGIRLDF